LIQDLAAVAVHSGAMRVVTGLATLLTQARNNVGHTQIE